MQSASAKALGLVVVGSAVFLVARAAGRRGRGAKGTRSKSREAIQLPQWLHWLKDKAGSYRVLMREWEDLQWRHQCGWQGQDLIHGPDSAVHIPCYFFDPSEKALRGPVLFRAGAESHRGLCHGGAMTSAMDDVLGHICFLAVGQGPWTGATVQVNCKLMKPVRVGQTLLVEARVVRQEKWKVSIEASLSDEAGEVYGAMEGLAFSGVKLQSEEHDVDRRKWVFDDTHRVVYDSGWDDLPRAALAIESALSLGA